MATTEPGLARNLHNRHIQLIAIGGTIGVGLFLGSARAIHDAGPALLLAYAVGGVAIFFIMRALGELLTYRPVAGSFASYAEEFCGPFAGFVTGWSYWFMWVLTAMAELTAIGIYVRYWFPDVPQWLPALVALVALYGANLLAVRVFGELEFWFALVKVVTIVALILAGLAVIVLHVGELGGTASFANLYTHGGFLPFGLLGDAPHPADRDVRLLWGGADRCHGRGSREPAGGAAARCTNGIILRILIFYLGALLVIMSLVPWNEFFSPEMSPFVFVFEKLRVPAAASIITAVVLTAAASSCNSGLFSTGRMLWTLAQRGQGPRLFAAPQRPARAGPPASTLCGWPRWRCVVILNYRVPEGGLHLGHEHRAHRHAVDLGHHPGVTPQLPARGQGRAGRRGAVPHAARPVRQLGRTRLPRDRDRHAVAGQGHACRLVRRAVLVRTPRRRLHRAAAPRRLRLYISGSPPPMTPPPSTTRVWPVMKLPAREASSTATPATSSGSPRRRSGLMRANAAARFSSAHSAREKRVRMIPGAMQLTRMLCGPHSTARLRASCMSAALEIR